jgi:hypothetical protein
MSLKYTALLLSLVGSILFVLGIIRGNAHSYDMNGYYLDASTGLTYAEQSTELLQIGGFIMLSIGIFMFLRVRVLMAR